MITVPPRLRAALSVIRNQLVFFVSLLFWLFAASVRIFGQSGDPLKLFELRYHPSRSLSVIFLERFMENGHVMREEAGKAHLLRPGKMRWEYEKPEKNLFLMDGKYVWFYAPADRTVTRVLANKSEDWRTP